LATIEGAAAAAVWLAGAMSDPSFFETSFVTSDLLDLHVKKPIDRRNENPLFAEQRPISRAEGNDDSL
jgi:hypothetical protein